MATTYPITNLGEIADRVLEQTRPYVARLNRIGVQFRNRPTAPGKTIEAPLVNVGEAAQYDRSTNNYCNDQGDVSLVPVTLGNHPKITVGVTPEAYDNLGEDGTLVVEDASIRQAAVKVGTAALRAFHNLLPGLASTGSAQYTVGATAANATKKTFSDILAVAMQGVAAAGGRPAFEGVEPAASPLVLSAPYYAAACAVFEPGAYDRTTNPVRDGWFEGGLLGFPEVLCDPMIPAGIAGYVLPYGSFALAERPVLVRNPGAYVAYEYRDDDRSGLALTIRTLVDACTDDRKTTVEALFGGVLALPAQVLTLVVPS